MNAETLAALRGSIKKWESIVAGTGYDAGTDNCPLCALFWKKELLENIPRIKISCKGCPVREKTKRAECLQTPYEEWSLAVRDHVCGQNEPFCERDGGVWAVTDRLRAAAQVELDFLRSLLPEGKEEQNDEDKASANPPAR